MTLFHTLSSGLIYLQNPETGVWAPGGSCAAIGDRAHWLTAAHCVPEGPESASSVADSSSVRFPALRWCAIQRRTSRYCAYLLKVRPRQQGLNLTTTEPNRMALR